MLAAFTIFTCGLGLDFRILFFQHGCRPVGRILTEGGKEHPADGLHRSPDHIVVFTIHVDHFDIRLALSGIHQEAGQFGIIRTSQVFRLSRIFDLEDTGLGR